MATPPVRCPGSAHQRLHIAVASRPLLLGELQQGQHVTLTGQLMEVQVLAGFRQGVAGGDDFEFQLLDPLLDGVASLPALSSASSDIQLLRENGPDLTARVRRKHPALSQRCRSLLRAPR